MVVNILKDAAAIGAAAATVFCAQVNNKPNSVLGFATGSTPLPTYKNIIEMNKKGAVDFSRVTSFNLDEYVGLERTHSQSYYTFMHENLFSHINIDQKKTNIPKGSSENADLECENYEKMIEAAGGIDLQILGIGSNGHIAFNEPDNYFPNKTHTVNLTESTIRDNTRFFSSEDEVPRSAVTMGIGTIMRAKKIIIICTGENKAAAVKGMIEGDIDPKCPASILKVHKDVTVFLDEAAAKDLTK